MSDIKSVCSNPLCPWSQEYCDPHKAEDAALNHAANDGMRMAGQGQQAVNKFGACIGLLPNIVESSSQALE